MMKSKELFLLQQRFDLMFKYLYVKYQEKHSLLLLCDITEAQAILSSDGKYGWHIEGLYNFPLDNNIYEIKEITKYEYDKLKR